MLRSYVHCMVADLSLPSAMLSNAEKEFAAKEKKYKAALAQAKQENVMTMGKFNQYKASWSRSSPVQSMLIREDRCAA